MGLESNWWDPAHIRTDIYSTSTTEVVIKLDEVRTI